MIHISEDGQGERSIALFFPEHSYIVLCHEASLSWENFHIRYRLSRLLSDLGPLLAAAARLAFQREGLLCAAALDCYPEGLSGNINITGTSGSCYRFAALQGIVVCEQ